MTRLASLTVRPLLECRRIFTLLIFTKRSRAFVLMGCLSSRFLLIQEKGDLRSIWIQIFLDDFSSNPILRQSRDLISNSNFSGNRANSKLDEVLLSRNFVVPRNHQRGFKNDIKSQLWFLP